MMGHVRERLHDERKGKGKGKDEGKGYGKDNGKTMKGTGRKGAGKSGRFKGDEENNTIEDTKGNAGRVAR